MKPELIFFGTGPVSLASLQGIFGAFTIEVIITKPDRQSPSGRIHDHPVKAFGAAHGIPVHQVENGAALAELFATTSLTSRVGLVIDFGLIIPQTVIDWFELGILNSHFSLLPKLRGADPISFAILEGLETTGVSLMQIVAALDEGDVLAQKELSLAADITSPQLTEQLVQLSNRLLVDHLPRYLAGELAPSPQVGEPSYTRKLSKADGVIDWAKPARQLEREVRAFLGWPGSRTTLHGVEVIVTAAHMVASGDESPLMHAAGGQTDLAIDRLKPIGRREISAAEFVRGYTKS